MALTAKQDMFVKEYLIDLNATQAAIRAGYSEKTAEVIGYENLRKPQIADAIEKAMQDRAEKVSITAENVLQSILDIRDCATRKIAITDKLGNSLGADAMVDFNAGLKANELLGKHLKLFTDKVEHTGTVTVETLTKEERQARINELLSKKRA